MSHAGRRIASAVAATAAVAVPVAAAASAQAAGLPVLGALPAVGSLAGVTGALPVGSLTGAAGPLSNIPVTGGSLAGGSTLTSVKNLPVVGQLAQNVSGESTDPSAAGQQSVPMRPAAPAAEAPVAAKPAPVSVGSAEPSAHHYVARHGRVRA
jgi:hypothetical protein